MPAAIFNGNYVKNLKPNLKLGAAEEIYIITDDTDDPTSVAKEAPQGSLFFRKGTTELYRKLDAGSSTNWELMVGISSSSSTDNAVPRFDGTSGDTIQNSGVSIDDSDNVSGIVNLAQTGYSDLSEISIPPAPSSGILRLLASDVDDITRLKLVDSSGRQTTVGNDVIYAVKNNTGATISKGAVVYVSGEDGGLPEVSLAQADAEVTANALGAIMEDIPNGGTGRALAKGKISGFNTSAFSNGDFVYLSESAAGSISATQPSHPNLSVRVGTILVSDISNGTFEVDMHTTIGGSLGTIKNSFGIGDNTAGTKQIDFKNGSTLSVTAAPTTNRTVALPDEDVTLAGNAGSSTDNALARFDGTSGALLQNSAVIAQDDGRLTIGADATGSLDVVTKQQLDAAISGVDVKEGVKAASTANLTLSGEQTIDGVSLVTGDRVLVKNQSTDSENGVYIVDSGAWSRSDDANSAAEINGALVTVAQGSTQANTGWYQSAEVSTLGSDTVTFNQFFGAGTYTADGDGIELSGSTFSLELNGSTLSKGTSGLQVAAGGITDTEINASAAIAYSKLDLADSIVNADINSSAAIAYSKLDLAGNIVNADINASAAIALSKLASVTSSRALASDGSGNISASSVTSTELGYLSGVTSAVQTQLNNKEEIYTLIDVSSNVTLTEHARHLVDTSSARTLTLPSSPGSGDILAIKDITGSADANNITIARAGSENIEGAASDYTIDSPYASIYLIADSSGDWWIL